MFVNVGGLGVTGYQIISGNFGVPGVMSAVPCGKLVAHVVARLSARLPAMRVPLRFVPFLSRINRA